MSLNKYILLTVLTMFFKVEAAPEITNLSSFTDIMTFEKTPYSYYDYMVDEKSGHLVYVFCDALDSSENEKYMSCNVTVKSTGFLDGASNKTCKVDFSSEPTSVLKMLNNNYLHRHQVILLNSDKILVTKNSYTPGEPNTMELLLVQMSECSVKKIITKTQLEPYLYKKEDFFGLIYFEPSHLNGTGSFTKVTYTDRGKKILKLFKTFISDSIWTKNYLFMNPVWMGSSVEVSYLHVLYSNSTGHVHHCIFQSGLDNKVKELIKTNNSIMGTSANEGTLSFCWLIGTNTISCKQYDSKGNTVLNVNGSFFDNSISWETELPVLQINQPSSNYSKSRQLKLHSLQDGGLLLVAINKNYSYNDSILNVQIESFDIVKIDQHSRNYTAPKKIQIEDDYFQSMRLVLLRSPDHLYFPRVNVFENDENICLAVWHDLNVTEGSTHSNKIKFIEKCFSKTYLL